MSAAGDALEPVAGDPGAVLRTAREAIDVTTREVAGALNLPIRVIEAIEANDLARMPQPVFARGYIRGYARLLDLDPDAIVAGYDLGEPVVETVRHVGGAVLRRQQMLVVAVAALLGVAVLGAAGWFAYRFVSERGAVVADRAGLPAETSPASAAPSGPATGDSASVADAVAPMAERADTVVLPPGNADAANPGVQRLTAAGDDELAFTFTDECWVEVKDSAGAVLYSQLGKAGETLRLIGQPPFRIRLGYAPGVTVAYNGESIPLAPHTRNTVASLVLGQ